MFCNNCGQKIFKDSIFCEHCGASLSEVDHLKTSRDYFSKFLKIFYELFHKIFLKNMFYMFFIILLFICVFIGYRYYIKAQESLATLQRDLSQLKAIKPTLPQTKEIDLAASVKTAVSSAGKKLTNQEIIKKVKPAVVFIKTSESSGSGMIIENNGYILTNAHVVSGVNSATTKLSDGRSFTAVIVGREENIDLALLKIDIKNAPVVELGDSNKLNQGDNIFTLGYPFGLEGEADFKEGTLSRRFVDDGITYLEISAAIYPGNSGGPLVNQLGQVVGINTAMIGRNIQGITIGETIKLAIPINLAKNIISTLKTGGASIANSSPAPVPAPRSDPRYFEFTGAGFCENNSGVSTIIIGSYELPSTNIIFWSDTKISFNVPTNIPSGQYSMIIRGYRMGRGYCSDVSKGITIY